MVKAKGLALGLRVYGGRAPRKRLLRAITVLRPQAWVPLLGPCVGLRV